VIAPSDTLAYLIVPIFAIAIDWAFYERTINLISFFFPHADIESEYPYRRFLGRRVAVVMIGSLMIAHGGIVDRSQFWLAIVGLVLCFLANLYIDFSIIRRELRGRDHDRGAA
jgi:hypothetical protein